VVAAELPRLATALRAALADLFATPDLAPAVARLRWRARLAYVLAIWPLARKRARAALSRRNVPRVAAAGP
jgi:hypothetical protein